MSTPKTPTHRDLLEKIKRYNAELIEKVNQYTQLCTSHSLPNMTEPMTSEHIRKKIVADMGFCFLIFFNLPYGVRSYDRTSYCWCVLY